MLVIYIKILNQNNNASSLYQDFKSINVTVLQMTISLKFGFYFK